MVDAVTDLFCAVDDFCKALDNQILTKLIPEKRAVQKRRTPGLCESEIMTITIFFQDSGYRNFKQYYLAVKVGWKRLFPAMPSYNRFIELMPRTLLHLLLYLQIHKGKVTGISFIDSTTIKVCNIKRAKRNKVFKGLATFGKSTIGWFFGFKLHLVINDVGELLGFKLTPGNVDDRVPVSDITKDILGKCVGDKGYISQALFEKLLQRGLHLVTSIRSNMKNKIMPMMDKIMLRKRSLIETVNDQLKNICHAEHSRHRSVFNFMVNMVSALIAYARKEKKPKMNFNPPDEIFGDGAKTPVLL